MAQPKNYVWDAQDYQKNSSNQYRWAQELIPKLHLNGNETLLDIGCGDGKITAEIAKHLPNGKVVGIDSSQEMIILAQTSFPNITFQHADARNLPFQDEFDRVFSNAALHWILDQKRVLASVFHSLKSGGSLLFQMGGKGNAKDILALFDEMLLEDAWLGFFEGFTFPYAFLDATEYRELLVDAGLVPVRVELIPKTMKLVGAEGLAGWIRTTWLPYTERVPAGLRDSFVMELVKCYLKTHPETADGEVTLDMVRLEVEAKKP
ncbi:MAG: methyltransferase domain-containing protein [Candidatus Bathyarchaeota archaeon]|nr:methyltransferase domain-containing protein [Candidatus Bathyarchaeota archaeon]